MKICVISEYFYPDNAGGTGTVLSNLVRHLKDTYDDLEIDVITSRHLYRGEARELEARQNWDGVAIRRLNTPRAHSSNIKKRLATNLRFSLATLTQLLRGPRYDLVLVSTAPPVLPLAAKAFKGLTGTPYAYVVYDLYPDIAVALGILPAASRPARVLHRLQAGWLHQASKTVVLGRCMADHLERQYHLARHKIEVIAIGADTGQVAPAPRQTQFRAAHNLDGFVVLWAGNFGQHQNFDAILDAAKLLQRQNCPVTFAFVGDGAKRDYLAKRIREERIENARMFPFVPAEQFSDLLASSNVSLVALEPGAEGLGVPSKFYNILASGRATVALVAPDSEVARVLEEQECGVRVEQNGVQLAQVIGELVGCPERVERMGLNARRASEEKYGLPTIARQFYDVSCAKSRARRGLRAPHDRRSPTATRAFFSRSAPKPRS